MHFQHLLFAYSNDPTPVLAPKPASASAAASIPAAAASSDIFAMKLSELFYGYASAAIKAPWAYGKGQRFLCLAWWQVGRGT